MQVFHRVAELGASDGKCAVAIGNFDGVHLGHAALLEAMVRRAKELDLTPAVLTFYPHPVEVLRPGTRLERLSTASEKLELLEALGVERVLVEKFDRDLAALSPEAFFERYLKEGLRAGSVHVGFNFRFGRERAGTTEALARLCEKAGSRLEVTPPREIEGERVSSTEVRRALREGQVEKASRFLGRPYFISGVVVDGDGKGGGLGFPTANLKFPSDKLVPAHGVYVTRTLWQKQAFASVTNVGIRPTLHGDRGRTVVETHLIDFSAPLYDEDIRVQFLSRIRDEIRFPSVEKLKEQIGRDVATARERNRTYTE